MKYDSDIGLRPVHKCTHICTHTHAWEHICTYHAHHTHIHFRKDDFVPTGDKLEASERGVVPLTKPSLQAGSGPSPTP